MWWTFRRYHFTHSSIGVIIDILKSVRLNLFILPLSTLLLILFFSISFCYRCLPYVCMHCHLNARNHSMAHLCHWHSLSFNININTAFVSALSELMFLPPCAKSRAANDITSSTLSPTPPPSCTQMSVWNVWILFAMGFFFSSFIFISPSLVAVYSLRLQFRMFSCKLVIRHENRCRWQFFLSHSYME